MKKSIYGLFFVSGAAGLIYQVVWTRVLTQVFGTTVFAVGTVLSAFMAGLAIGSYWLGRRADSYSAPLRVYAYYEIGIGITGVAALFFMSHLPPFYLWIAHLFGDSFLILTAGRFFAAFFLIIIPTTLMGATLPLLSRFLIVHLESLGRNLTTLYAINTFGAVVGTIFTGFFLISALGIHPTIYVAAMLNIGVGVTALLMSRSTVGRIQYPCLAKEEKKVPEAQKAMKVGNSSDLRIILWALGISGFTSFAYQIYWSRALVFVIGNSTYAFTIMLAAFLTGIALGSFLIRRFIDKYGKTRRILGWVEIAIGMTAAITIPVILSISYSEIMQSFFRMTRFNWDLALLLNIGIAFTIMLVPTILIGTTLPLVGKLYITDLQRTGASVGKVYAINTVGNILGALIPAFIILQFIGINKSIFLMAAANVAVGISVLLSLRHSSRLAYLSSSAVFMVLALLIFWLPAGMQFPSKFASSKDRILFYKEGIAATTQVYTKRDNSTEKYISVDGFDIGGTGLVDKKQQMLAHLPKLLLEEYETELSIGLGSGIVAGEGVRHRDLKKLTVVEIAPSVVEGAKFFAQENHDALRNSRINVSVNDGVNFLLTSTESYDIISSDAKSKPEYGGNGVFFSKEYYELAKNHLTGRGLMIQWVPTHLPAYDYLSVIKTFTHVFPYVSLWFKPPGDSFLVGTLRPLEVDFGKAKAMFSDHGQPLERLKADGITTAESLFAHYIASQESIKKATTSASINSLEHPIIEFYSFRDYAVPENQRQVENLSLILSVKDDLLSEQWLKNISLDDRARVQAATNAERQYLAGLKELMIGGSEVYTRIEGQFDKAISTAPWNDDIRYHTLSHLLELAKLEVGQNKFDEAEKFVSQAIYVLPGYSGEAHALYGQLLALRGASLSASFELKKAISLEPNMISPRKTLVSIYLKRGKQDKAIEQLKVITELDPDDVEAVSTLEMLLAK